MHFLSAVIITYNEETNIGRCIEALEQVADEIIIVDNFSTDQTLSIAKNYPVKIIEQSWLGFGPQKRIGVNSATFNNIIALDADEVLDQTAIEEIKILKLSGFKGVYEILLHHFYFGKFLQHGQEYPNYKKRIFCKDQVNWNENKVHESLIIPEGVSVFKLRGRINHYSYQSIEQYITKANLYTSIAAKALYEKRQETYFLKMFFSPSFTFIKSYFLKAGFLDGMHGFVVAMFNAYTNFLKYAKLWALVRKADKSLPDEI